jgi:hypothetical protein
MKEASFARMSTLLLIFGFVFTTVLFSAPAEKNTESGKVIATVGKVNVTYGELEKAFRKNMNRQALDKVSRDSINDFLNLFVNYKLKVLDAIDRGYDKDSSVQKEIETYRKVLAESFYYDRVIVEPNIKKLFEKRSREFKIAIIHIGINGVLLQIPCWHITKQSSVLTLLIKQMTFLKSLGIHRMIKEAPKKAVKSLLI